MNGKFFIDSFTTLTPISSFIKLSKELTDVHYLVSSKTMEIKDELTVPIYVQKKNGIKFRVSVIPLFGDFYLRITWTSKMLLEKYFEGINLGNFRAVFEFVMKEIDSWIDFSTFMEDSKINDVDVTCDFLSDNLSFNELISNYKNLPGAKTFYNREEHYLDTRQIIGLQFVNRSDASVSTPFVKFYSKLEELKTRSKEFYEFLTASGIHVSPIMRRVEVTLKNKKHIQNVFKKIDFIPEKITVSTFLNMSTHVLADIVNHCISRYDDNNFDVIPSQIKSIKTITPTNYLLAQACYELMKEGYTVRNFLALLDKSPVMTPTAKSRIKKRLKKSLDILFKYEKVRNLKFMPKDAFLD